MFKLKNEIDIKELKKYGFKVLFGTPYNAYAYNIGINKNIYICVDRVKRIFYTAINYGDKVTDEEEEKWNILLFKLIEAGFIEIEKERDIKK